MAVWLSLCIPSNPFPIGPAGVEAECHHVLTLMILPLVQNSPFALQVLRRRCPLNLSTSSQTTRCVCGRTKPTHLQRIYMRAYIHLARFLR
jgi:hypothetical protein